MKGKEMNKPVAIRYDFDGYGYQYIDSGSGSDWQTRVDGEPLYTHPVKELTLTDDEIDDVWAACSTGESDTIDMHLFAEAILKKAQEK